MQINYQSIGSGGGIQQLKNGLVDFGASDVALTDQQLTEMPPMVQIPESAGPVCITYNLPNLSKPLHLSADTLAGIFLGNINKWNDPVHHTAQSRCQFAAAIGQILVAHHSDGSGTTGIFTSYLSAVSPEWKSKVGTGISVKLAGRSRRQGQRGRDRHREAEPRGRLATSSSATLKRTSCRQSRCATRPGTS